MRGNKALALFCCALWLILGKVPACAQDDSIDAERTERYVARLQTLQQARVKLRARSAALWEQSPYMKEELTRALLSLNMTAGQLNNTPLASAIPTLLGAYDGPFRARSDFATRLPQYTLWYTFQDNTLLRNQLMIRLAGTQSIAADKLAGYRSTLAGLEQVSAAADANFFEFRHAADLMGRRSPLEIQQAREISEAWLVDDPVHAGAALINVYSLRMESRFDECNRLMSGFDSNFALMNVIHETLSAQIEFLGGDIANAQKRLVPLTQIGNKQPVGEPYLVRSWLHLAEGKFDEAQKYAAKLRTMDGQNIEAVIVEGLATAMSSPRRAKEGLKILRAGQLFSSPEDWHYHEALAIVHTLVGDQQFARREITLALQHAPSHIRPELEEERKIIDRGQLPPVNWNERLVKLWQY